MDRCGPGRRGQRLGTALLDRVLPELAAAGVSVVEAKTLDRSADYLPYEAIRAFWEHKEFVQIDTIDPLPRWPLGNPGGHLRCGLSVDAMTSAG